MPYACRVCCRDFTLWSASTSLYNARSSSRGGCRALQLYSALHLYSSTALYTLHPLHPPSGSGIVRAVHQSSSKLGDTPLVRLDLFESLPSRRVCCRASTTNSTAKSRSTVLYICIALSRAGCRALQLYSALQRSTSLQLYSALHSTSSTPSLRSSGVCRRQDHPYSLRV